MLFRTPEALESTTVVAAGVCNKPWSVGLKRLARPSVGFKLKPESVFPAQVGDSRVPRERSRGLGRLFSATIARSGTDLEAGRGQVRVILRTRGAWGPGGGSGVDGCAGLRVSTGTR